MEAEYKVISIQKKSKPVDKYDFPITETRYIIVSTTEDNKILDDAQGYGYKTSQKAEKAAWYKFKDGKAKTDSLKSSAEKFWKTNSSIKDDIEDMLFRACKEGTDEAEIDIAGYIKRSYNLEFDPKWIKYM